MKLALIADAFEFIRNGASIKQNENSTGIPITRIETIWKSTIDGDRFGYANIENIDEYKNHLLKDGDILMSHINSPKHLGKCAIYQSNPKILIHGMNLLNLRPNKDIMSPKFIYYYFGSNSFKQQITKISNQSVNQASFSSGNLKKLKIPLPSLTEQQKIAAILDAADSLRQKDQQLVKHYTMLSQSLFLDMFGDPVTNPMGWEKSSADSHIDLLTGFAFKSSDYSSNLDDIHLCGGLIITPSGIDWSKANFWSRNKLDGLDKYRLANGDIVMAMDRPWISSGFKIHKITTADKESLLVQRTARIRGKNINQEFLYFLFKHPAFEMQAKTTETTVPHISPNDIRKYELLLPPLEMQNQFAERIAIIEQQKQQAQVNLEKSEALFNSLLQRAFNGELTGSKAA
jgi:type I restriction enzyme, S subunit